MSGSTARLDAVKAVTDFERSSKGVDYLNTATTDVFGENVFSIDSMRASLPKAVFKQLNQTITTGAKMDSHVADVVAAAMKEWAVSKGATHYTHVFILVRKCAEGTAPMGPGR